MPFSPLWNTCSLTKDQEKKNSLTLAISPYQFLMFSVKFPVLLQFSQLKTALIFLLPLFRMFPPRTPCPPVGVYFSPYCFFLYWSSLVVSGATASNLNNLVNSLFSLLPLRKDIWFKEHLILNKQQQNSLALGIGALKTKWALAAFCLAAAFLLLLSGLQPPEWWWSSPHIYSLLCSQNLESSFICPVSFQKMHNSVLQILFHWKCTNQYKDWYQALHWFIIL